MKKKLKLAFEQLEREFPMLNLSEQNNVKGGTDTLQIYGGYLVEVEGGIRYYGNDGSTVFFPGVDLNVMSRGSALTSSGTMNISGSWAANANISDIAHEYGHHLQQQSMSDFQYYLNIAVPSVLSASWSNIIGDNGDYHYSRWYEMDASQLGNDFLSINMWNPSTYYDHVSGSYSGYTSGYTSGYMA